MKVMVEDIVDVEEEIICMVEEEMGTDLIKKKVVIPEKREYII